MGLFHYTSFIEILTFVSFNLPFRPLESKRHGLFTIYYSIILTFEQIDATSTKTVKILKYRTMLIQTPLMMSTAKKKS